MALQINRTLTTQNGFDVPSGAYVWLLETRGQNRDGYAYTVKVDVIFFKDKASFDSGKKRFFPVEVPENLYSFSADFTAANYASLTPLTVHNYIKGQLEGALGASTVTVVQ
jgi:hypothetical protein